MKRMPISKARDKRVYAKGRKMSPKNRPMAVRGGYRL